MRVLAHLISHNKGWMAEQFEYGIRLSLGQLINAIQVSRYLLEACRRKDYFGLTNWRSRGDRYAIVAQYATNRISRSIKFFASLSRLQIKMNYYTLLLGKLILLNNNKICRSMPQFCKYVWQKKSEKSIIKCFYDLSVGKLFKKMWKAWETIIYHRKQRELHVKLCHYVDGAPFFSMKSNLPRVAGYNSSCATVAVVSISQNSNIHLRGEELLVRATCIHLAWLTPPLRSNIIALEVVSNVQTSIKSLRHKGPELYAEE